jgi:hypothetical protein
VVVGISTKWQIKLHDGFIENFTDLCSAAAADKLPRPSRGGTRPGAGLGLSRWVGEWCEDDELLDKGEALKISSVSLYK